MITIMIVTTEKFRFAACDELGNTVIEFHATSLLLQTSKWKMYAALCVGLIK